ncbi:MAG: alanyl-tRNA editing protein [Halolamina sp.]
MPLSLAPDDPDVRRFEADVVRVDGAAVVLEETYFYAESGGQPADRGVVDGVSVADVQEQNGEVVHTLADADHGIAAGDTVACTVDDEFRTYCARAHTASHVLYGAGRRLLDDLGYGGFGIDEEKVRVDFTTTTTIDDEALVELERLTNRAVWDSLSVSWETVPVADARDRDDVAFNTKTEEGVMAEADTVRVVTVEGWDAAACGGTHVRDTSEIGPVTVLDRSNPGEGLTRVEFAVGPIGVDRRATVHEAARRAAGELDAGVANLTEATRRLRTERDDLAEELADLKGEVLSARLADLPTVDRDGATWRVGTVADFGPNEVGDAAQGVADDGATDVVAAAGQDGATFVVVASDDPSVGAGDLVDDVTGEFGGGGGGSPAFAQGGGLDADPEAVAAFLRES